MQPDENRITYFASTDARNRKVPFGIKAKDRTRHVYVIGKTGMGKSTLLENMAIQDIQNGEGLAFIDPHGKTAQLLLEYVPEHRLKDVLYFAPFDLENPIAFNIMEDIGPDKRHLVVSGLMSAFEKIWVDAWSARMAYILQNTLHALLEYPGATLLGVNKMLTDKEYRKKVVENISDPTVKSFWVDEFAKYTDKFAAEATPAIQNKVGQFTSNPLIRNIIGQEKSSFDIRKIMDEKKILIINLSKGLVGENNANLLGSMLVTKIYLAAMSRADANEKALSRLPNFYLYVDEFQSFANKSFADILSEARKYKLNLTIAHQYIEQMEEEVRAAVFGNVGTMIAFRVGAFDAEILEKEFAPVFLAEDMVNLGFAQVYLKLMIDGVSSQPFSATTMPPISKPVISYKENVIELSRKQFAAPRGEVEKKITEQLTTVITPKPEKNDKKQDGNFVKSNNFSNGSNNNHANNSNNQKIAKDVKEFKTGNHLNALRNTLAGVLGESDLVKPIPKEENIVSKEEIIKKPIELPKDSVKKPFEVKDNNKVKNQQFNHPKKDNKDNHLNPKVEANSHHSALAEVLKQLQNKDDDGEKNEQSVKKEIPKEELIEKKGVSNDELRAMLHVDEENS